jgi:hypothetical protein
VTHQVITVAIATPLREELVASIRALDDSVSVLTEPSCSHRLGTRVITAASKASGAIRRRLSVLHSGKAKALFPGPFSWAVLGSNQ